MASFDKCSVFILISIITKCFSLYSPVRHEIVATVMSLLSSCTDAVKIKINSAPLVSI